MTWKEQLVFLQRTVHRYNNLQPVEQEEIVSITLIRLLETECKYKEEGKRKGWLILNLHYVFLYYVSTSKRRAEIWHRKKYYLQPLPNDGEHKQGGFSKPVLKALVDIPAKNREALIKCYVLDMTEKDLSEENNVPLGTTKSRIWKGKNKLKEELRELAREDYNLAAE
jgi:DNA-directed RNA polymerase specialized sigma24 family protein